MKTDSTLPIATLEKHDAVITNACTEDDKRRALEAIRVHQEKMHPHRAVTRLTTWNGRVVPL
jgi:hypothetical protein